MTGSSPKSASVAPPAGISPAAGCAIALLVTAIGIAAVFAAGSLLVRGDLVVARGELTQTRLWLIRESDQEGFGFSHDRLVSRGEARSCVLTRVDFLLWQSSGDAAGTSYCSCYERRQGGWEEVGSCPP